MHAHGTLVDRNRCDLDGRLFRCFGDRWFTDTRLLGRRRFAGAATPTAATAASAPLASAFTLAGFRGLGSRVGLRLVGVARATGDRRDLVLEVLGLEAARERDRGRVGGTGLAPTSTSAASARLLGGVLVVVVLDRRRRRGRKVADRRHRQRRQTIDLDVGVAIVVGVHVEAVEAERLGDPHVDPLVEGTLEPHQLLSTRTQQARGDAHRHHELEASDPLVGEQRARAAQGVRGDGIGQADLAVADAGRALCVVGLAQARPHALPSDLDDAEVAHRQHGRPGAILLEGVREAVLDVLAVLVAPHVDHVAHDETAEIAQPQLAADLLDRFAVRSVGVGLAVPCGAALAAVDVDRDERLGLIEDQGAARRQRHLAGVDQLDLPLDVEGVEDRRLAAVEAHGRARSRRDHRKEGARPGEGRLAVDHDRGDARVEHVAQRAQEQVALGVELAGSAHRVHALLHHLPKSGEVGRVAGKVGLRRGEAGGAKDEAEALGQVQRVEDPPHLLPLRLVLHLAAHADLVHPRHHHEQPARDRQVARERRPLRAEAFLEHLHEDLRASLQRFLHERSRLARHLLADLLGLVAAREVLRMEVGDVEEAVLPLSEVDERGLDRRLDVGHLALVDVADVRRGRDAFGGESVKASLVEDRDAALLAGRVVDDHHPVEFPGGGLVVRTHDGFAPASVGACRRTRSRRPLHADATPRSRGRFAGWRDCRGSSGARPSASPSQVRVVPRFPRSALTAPVSREASDGPALRRSASQRGGPAGNRFVSRSAATAARMGSRFDAASRVSEDPSPRAHHASRISGSAPGASRPVCPSRPRGNGLVGSGRDIRSRSRVEAVILGSPALERPGVYECSERGANGRAPRPSARRRANVRIRQGPRPLAASHGLLRGPATRRVRGDRAEFVTQGVEDLPL